MQVRQTLVSPSKYSLKCPYSMIAEYITIHNTANDASANNEVAYMIGNSNQTSFHFAVDDIEAVQGIPIERNAWHCGDGANGTGNRKSIGIEICYSKSGGTRFERAEQNAAMLTAILLKERGWGVDRLRTHKDWSGKNCPHRTVFSTFKNMVQNNLSNTAESIDMANMYKGYDLANPESMKVAVDILVRVQNGEFVEKSAIDRDYVSRNIYSEKEQQVNQLNEKITKLEGEKKVIQETADKQSVIITNQAAQIKDLEKKLEAAASNPSTPENPVTSGGTQTGYNVIMDVNGKTIGYEAIYKKE